VETAFVFLVPQFVDREPELLRRKVLERCRPSPTMKLPMTTPALLQRIYRPQGRSGE
jgi:hypothetical protein